MVAIGDLVRIALRAYLARVEEDPNGGTSLGDAILTLIVGIVLTWLFFTPIKETVQEAVRPIVDRLLPDWE